MRERGAALLIVLGLAAASAACGSSETRVVDQYFNALRAGDNQTLSSFAMVGFDKKVDRWSVTHKEPENRSAATLPDLVKKVKDLEAELAKNKKEAQTYSLNPSIYSDIEKIKDLQKGNRPIPPNLKKVADEWKAYNDKDRELKKGLSEAKAAVEKEKRNVVLSVGQRDDVESLTGDMVSKKVTVNLTIGGSVQPYVMGLRKYEVAGGTGRIVSRWVVESLEPKG